MKPIIFKLFLWLIASTAIAGTVYIGFSKYIDPIEDSEESSEAAEIEGRYEQEFLMTRDRKTNTIPRERLLKAYETAQLLRLEKAGDALPIYWMERGPNNVGGRTRALLIDANDPSGRTVWAAGVSGGLWRTDNIDANPPNWASIDDFFDNLAITTIAQDPNNPNIMYFGTGEIGFLDFGENNRIGAKGVNGDGIWRSTDGGLTWDRLSSSGSLDEGINKILVDDNSWVYAATRRGLRRSTNNGMSWTFVTIQNSGGSEILDIEIASNGDIYVTINDNAIGRLRNGANTWEIINSGTDTDIPSSNLGRIEIAITPNNPNLIYAAYEDDSDKSCQAILKSTDGGDSWTPHTVPPDFGDQCFYNLILAVDPNNTNRLWAGGVNLFVSDDSGDNWTLFSKDDIHNDHHAIIYRPSSSDEIVFGNDGGVYRCTNGSDANPTLIAKNKTYNVTQFYSVALHPDAGSNYMLGGTQDNGTRRFRVANLDDTDEPSCNDGAFCFIDEDTPNIQITGSQFRQFFLSTDGGSSFSCQDISITPEDRSLFILPADYDDDENILYISGTDNNFSRLTDIGATNTFVDVSVSTFSGVVSSIKVSPNNSNRVYFGLGTGDVVLVDNAHTGNSKTGTIIRNGTNWVSGIDIEVGNEDHVLVTYSNYGADHVWETTDGGNTWQNIEGNLPDMPVRWVVFNPLNTDQALIATELGVWSTSNLDGSNTKWYPTNFFGLANVRVDMLQFRESDYLLAAATHGRGIFTTDYFSLFGTCPPDLTISGNIPSGVYYIENNIESDGTVPSNGKVIFRAGEEILLTDGFTVEEGADFWGIILPCTPGNGLRNSLVLSKTSEENPLSSFNFKFYPNPTVNDAIIEYKLEQSDVVSLEVRDIRGIMVAKLIDNKTQMSGTHTINFDTSNLKSGIYLITFKTKGKSVTEKVIVAKS